LRAIILYNGDLNELSENGIYANVDIDQVIKRVYISPYSKTWFSELVKSVSAKYNLNADIAASSLIAEPVY
jgi:hypothetical protein